MFKAYSLFPETFQWERKEDSPNTAAVHIYGIAVLLQSTTSEETWLARDSNPPRIANIPAITSHKTGISEEFC